MDGETEGVNEAPAAVFLPSNEGWTLISDNRFADMIADLWIKQTGDDLSVGMFCEERHDNGTGTIHGGMICTLADISLGKMIRLRRNRDQPPDAPGIASATIQLDVNFCGRVGRGDFVYSKAIIKSMSRSLTFAQGELCVCDRTVAIMQGVYKVIDSRRGV